MSVYIPDHFAARDRATIARLVHDFPFATLVTPGAAEPLVTHLPLLHVADCEPHGTLVGHFARANPHAQQRRGRRIDGDLSRAARVRDAVVVRRSRRRGADVELCRRPRARRDRARARCGGNARRSRSHDPALRVGPGGAVATGPRCRAPAGDGRRDRRLSHPGEADRRQAQAVAEPVAGTTGGRVAAGLESEGLRARPTAPRHWMRRRPWKSSQTRRSARDQPWPAS